MGIGGGGLQVKISSGNIQATTTNSDLLITYNASVNQSATKISVRPSFSPEACCEHALISSTDPNPLLLDHLRDKPVIPQTDNLDRPVSGRWGFRYCFSRNYVSGRKTQVRDGSALSDLWALCSCQPHVWFTVYLMQQSKPQPEKGHLPLLASLLLCNKLPQNLVAWNLVNGLLKKLIPIRMTTTTSFIISHNCADQEFGKSWAEQFCSM